jgi:hypothetical protein
VGKELEFPGATSPGATEPDSPAESETGNAEAEEVEHKPDRLRDVERDLRDTREQMISGFGDVKETIAKTETAIVKEISASKDSSSNRTFTAMGIVIGVIAIGVAILIAVLGK